MSQTIFFRCKTRQSLANDVSNSRTCRRNKESQHETYSHWILITDFKSVTFPSPASTSSLPLRSQALTFDLYLSIQHVTCRNALHAIFVHDAGTHLRGNGSMRRLMMWVTYAISNKHQTSFLEDCVDFFAGSAGDSDHLCILDIPYVYRFGAEFFSTDFLC